MRRPHLADFVSTHLNAPNVLAGAFFIAVGAAFGTLSIFNLDIGTALQMGPGYFPLILSALMILLGVAISISKPDAATDEPSHPLPWRGLLLVGSTPIVFAALVTPLGLAPAIALAVATVTYASRKATPKLAFLITLGVTALCIAVFKFGLGIPAPLFNPKLGGQAPLMEILDKLFLGFATAALPLNLLFCFLGVLIGTLIGVLPGIGPTATIAMLMPIALSLSPEAALIMLAGIYYGAQYGGSTTAILINVPGESSAAVTALDGHQLARQGRAGPALAVAAIGSFFAGTVATLIIVVFAPPLTAIAIRFGPAEYVGLIVLGLISSVALAHGSVLKALAMLMLGLLLGVIGTDIYTGAQRFTFGLLGLSDGLNFVAIAIGAFGLAEVIRNLENENNRAIIAKRVTGLMPTRDDWRRITFPIIRGTTLGSLLGILPGAGAVLAAFAAYAVEKKLSKTPEQFGKGAIEGVAGPELANNASAQTSFIPMLTLGIPANPVMALMIGAMIIQGIVPGPNVVKEQPALFWGTIASMWIGNLMLLLLNLPLIGIWVRLLTIPYYVLFPAILAFSAIGVYGVSNNVFDLYTLALFGVGSYALSRLGCEPAPLLLGFVLGPMLEEHLRRGMMLFDGNPLMFFQRPISAILLLAAVLLLAALSVPSIMQKRRDVFAEKD